MSTHTRQLSFKFCNSLLTSCDFFRICCKSCVFFLNTSLSIAKLGLFFPQANRVSIKHEHRPYEFGVFSLNSLIY